MSSALSASAASPCSRLPSRRIPVDTVARSSENTILSMHWISSSILGVSVSRLRSASLKRRCVPLRAAACLLLDQADMVKEELQDGLVTDTHVKGDSIRDPGGSERHHGASVLLREPPGAGNFLTVCSGQHEDRVVHPGEQAKIDQHALILCGREARTIARRRDFWLLLCVLFNRLPVRIIE